MISKSRPGDYRTLKHSLSRVLGDTGSFLSPDSAPLTLMDSPAMGPTPCEARVSLVTLSTAPTVNTETRGPSVYGLFVFVGPVVLGGVGDIGFFVGV